MAVLTVVTLAAWTVFGCNAPKTPLPAEPPVAQTAAKPAPPPPPAASVAPTPAPVQDAPAEPPPVKHDGRG
jgi:hypothetical protein